MQTIGIITDLKHSNYCEDAKQNVYSSDLKTLNTVINKINPTKAPDGDLIIGFRYKKLGYYRESLVTLLKNTYDEEIDLHDWLSCYHYQKLHLHLRMRTPTRQKTTNQ